MSREQKRIINDQQKALQKAHRALLEQALASAELVNAFGKAVGEALSKIENGYPHCAASQLRDYLNELNSEKGNDSNH